MIRRQFFVYRSHRSPGCEFDSLQRTMPKRLPGRVAIDALLLTIIVVQTWSYTHIAAPGRKTSQSRGTSILMQRPPVTERSFRFSTGATVVETSEIRRTGIGGKRRIRHTTLTSTAASLVGRAARGTKPQALQLIFEGIGADFVGLTALVGLSKA